MNRTIHAGVLLVLVLAATPGAAADEEGIDECRDARLLPLAGCVASGALPVAGRTVAKLLPGDGGDWCLPFEGYNTCN